MLKKLRNLTFVVLTSSQFTHAMESNEDQFDFLTSHYPELVEKAQKPFELCCEENKHYQKLESITKKTQTTAPQVLMGGVQQEMNKTTLHYWGQEHEKFMLDQLKEFILPLAQGHPQHGYFKVYFDRALKNHTILENILLSAEYLYQVVKDQKGTNVIFLGRTPCLVQVAYEEICKIEKDEVQRPVHLNFSGHPDALSKRESDFFKSDTNIARDMVSPDKLNHYFNYLDTKEILATNKLFVVDILTTGGSLNSFLRVLHAYYQNKGRSIPEVVFLNLSQDASWSFERPEFYTFTKTGETNNKGILSLPEDAKKNMKPFKLAAYGIPIFDKVLTEILDQDMFQEFLVHGIQYPAQKWTAQFDAQMKEGGAYHREFYEYLRSNFRDFINSHAVDSSKG